MARVLKVTDGTTTVDWISGNLYLREGGMELEGLREVGWDVYSLFSKDTATDANVRTEIDNLEKLFDQARRYAGDLSYSDPVWVYFQSEGESVKRALLVNGRIKMGAESTVLPWLGVGGAGAEVAINRLPDFEPDTATNVTTTGLSADGGAWVPGNAAGVNPQRIQLLEVQATSATALTKIWLGIRRLRYGSASFKALWEAELGTLGTDASTQVVGGTSGGSIVRISFATPTLLKRLEIEWRMVAGVSPTYSHIIGNYLVLARIKLDAATETRIVLKHGWAGNAQNTEVVGEGYFSSIENTNLTGWNLVELGTVTVPPSGNRLAEVSGKVDRYSLALWCERLTGSNLEIDCLILIPTDGLLTVDNAYLTTTSGPMLVYTSPLDEQYAVCVLTPTENENINVDASFQGWFYPREGGIIVAAAQGSASHVLSRTLALDMDLYPRWTMYRP